MVFKKGQLLDMPSDIHFSYIAGNAELTSLPTNIVNLSSLNTLKADNCSITHLPSRFGELSSLKTLSMSENKLKTLPYRLVT